MKPKKYHKSIHDGCDLELSREKAKEIHVKINLIETIVKYSAGIDISYKDFVASIAVIDSCQNVQILSTNKFHNLQSGFKAMLALVVKFTKNASNIVFAMEATGVYYERLAYYLYFSQTKSWSFCSELL